MNSEESARVRAISDDEFIVEFFYPIERTKEEVDEYRSAIENLAKNKSTMTFFTSDYYSITKKITNESRIKLIENFGIRSFISRKKCPDTSNYESLEEYTNAFQEWMKNPISFNQNFVMLKSDFWIDDRKHIDGIQNIDFGKAVYITEEKTKELDLIHEILNGFGSWIILNGHQMKNSIDVTHYVNKYIKESKDKLYFKIEKTCKIEEK